MCSTSVADSEDTPFAALDSYPASENVHSHTVFWRRAPNVVARFIAVESSTAETSNFRKTFADPAYSCNLLPSTCLLGDSLVSGPVS